VCIFLVRWSAFWASCFSISTSAWLNPFATVAGRTEPKKKSPEFYGGSGGSDSKGNQGSRAACSYLRRRFETCLAASAMRAANDDAPSDSVRVSADPKLCSLADSGEWTTRAKKHERVLVRSGTHALN
jgi:hypothetical protein